MRVFLLGVMMAVAALMPASTMADDQQIADFIKARLMQEKQQGNLFGFNVDMRVDRGTVWFKGFVSNRSQELLILRTAQLAGHLGVVQVVDDIDVNAPYNQAMPMQQNAMQQNAMQKPLQPVMPQERVAMQTQQAYTSGAYQQQNQPQMQQRQPVRFPQQAYPQPQSQRQTAPAVNGRQNFPQGATPLPPRRMEMPMSSKVPKKDTATQAVAYQEPIGQALRPNPMMTMRNNRVPAMQPSFQNNLNGIPATQTAAPIPSPPTPVAGSPLPFARASNGCIDGGCATGGGMMMGGGYYGDGAGIVNDSASLPGYAWPAYAAHPNYGAVSYPKQYSASAWPYIGPFYPYPQVPLGWRKVSLEWDDGWWFLDFNDKN